MPLAQERHQTWGRGQTNFAMLLRKVKPLRPLCEGVVCRYTFLDRHIDRCATLNVHFSGRIIVMSHGGMPITDVYTFCFYMSVRIFKLDGQRCRNRGQFFVSTIPVIFRTTNNVKCAYFKPFRTLGGPLDYLLVSRLTDIDTICQLPRQFVTQDVI